MGENAAQKTAFSAADLKEKKTQIALTYPVESASVASPTGSNKNPDDVLLFGLLRS